MSDPYFYPMFYGLIENLGLWNILKESETILNFLTAEKVNKMYWKADKNYFDYPYLKILMGSQLF